jgi:hypothetical protein
MHVIYKEKCEINPEFEIRFGRSSWDENKFSVKFTWFDKTGKACRGGEVPLEAVEQMVAVAEKGRAIISAMPALAQKKG